MTTWKRLVFDGTPVDVNMDCVAYMVRYQGEAYTSLHFVGGRRSESGSMVVSVNETPDQIHRTHLIETKE